MRPERDQPIALERTQGAARLRIEPQLVHGRFSIRDIARAESRIGLQQEQTTVERIGMRRRKEVVLGTHARTGQTTIALPWCHDGS